jgi:hypothetical protein
MKTAALPLGMSEVKHALYIAAVMTGLLFTENLYVNIFIQSLR